MYNVIKHVRFQGLALSTATAVLLVSAMACTAKTQSAATSLSDSTSPVATITTPAGPLKGGATVDLAFSATDAGGLASLNLQYSADGTAFSTVATLSTSATSYSWTVPSSDVSTARLKIVAVDSAGNSVSATSDAFTVDSTGPTVTLPVPTGTLPTLAGTVRAGRKVDLTLAASDTNGVASINLEYAANGTTFVPVATLAAGSTSYSWAVPGESTTLSSAKLKLTAVDLLGNSNSTTTSAFAVKPCQIVFYSKRNLDLTNNGAAATVSNAWTVNADGTDLQALTGVSAASSDVLIPMLSPDGSKIVFYSKRNLDGTNGGAANAAYNIWIMNSDGTNPQALTQVTAAGADSSGTLFSNDGTKIYYGSKRNLDGLAGSAANAARNIWVMNVDGTNSQALTQVTTSAADSSAPKSISPDGTKLAYLSKRSFDGANTGAAVAQNNVWIMNVDGTGAAPLTQITSATFTITASPFFTSDGTRIIYNSARNLDGTTAGAPNSSGNVWVVNTDGTGSQALTLVTAASAGISGDFSVSLSGNKIFYSPSRTLDGSLSTVGVVANLWLLNPNSLFTSASPTAFTQISTATAASYSPIWRGSQVIYQSKRNLDGTTNGAVNGSLNLWIANADGSGTHTSLTQVTTSDSTVPLGPGSISASCIP